MSETKLAVVVLNYNGRHFLERFLGGIVRCSGTSKVFVADNKSTDDSVAYVRSGFPSVEIIENAGNFGYAMGYSKALSEIKAEYYVLLNSDVEVTENWTAPIIDLMDRDKSIAACQPKILDYAHRNLFEYAGASGGFIDTYGYPFCRGRLFNHIETDSEQYNNATEVFWASGACLFVRASAYYQAGGLDDRYFAHMEEIDLCWRLKNFGHKIMVVPQSVVYHIGGGTLNKYSHRKTFLNFRNNLTTLTKNHAPGFLFAKVIYRMVLDGIAAFKFLFEGQPRHFLAVIHAHFAYYTWFPYIISERKRLKASPGFRYTRSNIYKGNIVKEHFILKKKTFGELTGGYFES